MIRLKSLLPESVNKIHYVIEANIVYKNDSNATDDKASSASDEFLVWFKYYPVANKAAKFNAKLTNVETFVPKEEAQDIEQGGLLKKLGKSFLKAVSGSTTPGIEFEFTSPRFKGTGRIALDYKNGKFTLGAVRKFAGRDAVDGYLTDEAVDKFIKYLLTQSQYAEALKQAFPDIENALTANSFKK